MISIVTYLWHDPRMTNERHVIEGGSIRPDLLPSYRQRRRGVPMPQLPRNIKVIARGGQPVRSFKHEHVVQQAKCFKANLTVPHRFICVTDELPRDHEPGVEWVLTPPAWRKLGELNSPEGFRFPSCYRRLGGFSDEARRLLGERVFLTDIDAVPVGNMDRLMRRQEQFVGWRPFRDWGRRLRFGGGTYLMETGTRTHVYTDFKGAASINEARAAGFRGSDQAWISYKLADREPYYDRNSGIYSIRDLGNTHDLPRDACLVHFNGNDKPWSYRGPAEWVARHWNLR